MTRPLAINCNNLVAKPKGPRLAMAMGKPKFSSKLSLLMLLYFMLTLMLLSQPLLAVAGTVEVDGEAVKTGRSSAIYSRRLLEEDDNGTDDGDGKAYIQRAPRPGPPSPIANLSKRAGVDPPPLPPPPPPRKRIIYPGSRPNCPRCQIP